jgi:hypothetical protein
MAGNTLSGHGRVRAAVRVRVTGRAVCCNVSSEQRKASLFVKKACHRCIPALTVVTSRAVHAILATMHIGMTRSAVGLRIPELASDVAVRTGNPVMLSVEWKSRILVGERDVLPNWCPTVSRMAGLTRLSKPLVPFR